MYRTFSKALRYALRFIFSLLAGYTTYLNLNQIIDPELVEHDRTHNTEDFFTPHNLFAVMVLIPLVISSTLKTFFFMTKPLTEEVDSTDLSNNLLTPDEKSIVLPTFTRSKKVCTAILNISSLLESGITLTNSSQVLMHACLSPFSFSLSSLSIRNVALIFSVPTSILATYLEAFAENAVTTNEITDGKPSWMSQFHAKNTENALDKALTYAGVGAHSLSHGIGLAAAIGSLSSQAHQTTPKIIINIAALAACFISTKSIFGPTAAFESNSPAIEKLNKTEWISQQSANKDNFLPTTLKLWISAATHGIEMSLPTLIMALHSKLSLPKKTAISSAAFITLMGTGVNMATEGKEAANDYAEIHDEKYGNATERNTSALIIWGACAGKNTPNALNSSLEA